MARRWIEIIPFIGDIFGLVFAFIAQQYTISLLQADGSSITAGTILHRKNPFIVKMLLDTSMAPASVHPYIPLAATALLAIIDSAKNS